MNWRVRWEDVMIGSPEKNRKLERQGSRMSLNRVKESGENWRLIVEIIELFC